MKKEINLMLGTDYRGKGGIAFVLNNYKKNLLLKKINSKLIITHRSNLGKLDLVIIFFNALIKIIYYLIFYKVKIVHIHSASNFSFFRKSIFLLICNFFSIKIFFHIHGGNFDFFYKNSNYFVKKFINFILNKSNKIIVLNPYYKSFLKKNNIIKKIIIIPNSLVLKKNNKPSKIFKKKFVLFLGNLEKRKGVNDILDAIKIISKKKQSINFIFCGVDHKDFYKNLAKSLKIEKNIKFIKWVSGKTKTNILNNTKILILPSYNENLPVSILEAMNNSIPVISTKVGGIPFQVKHNFSGYLIKPGNNFQLARCIIKLNFNKKLNKKFGERGNEIFQSKFSNDIVFKKIINLYNY